ncbi:ABC transporter substrate-binding protein [Nocardia neocaledoniensis]|uniref:ABC transporter substrate-binding protein n=1 Tax=Nocardia neocaledoniensis TaxID=236511 RepID=UPI0024587C74|nr:ABC transporter substrate-binding protein [Nocardia neocaledoniensis]
MVAAVVVGLTACAKTGAQGDTDIHLAVVADLTGLGHPVGVDGADGFSTAIAAMNERGGVAGRRVVVDRYDTQSEPNGAQVAFRTALAKRPAAIYYSGLSATLHSVLPLLRSAKVPVVASSATPEAVKEPWFFTAYAIPEGSANVLVDAAKQAVGGSLRGKNIAIVSNSGPGSAVQIPLMEKAVAAGGGQVVVVEQTDTGIASFASQAQKIVSRQPDAVLTLQAGDQVTVTKALVVAGMTGPIVGTIGGASDTQIKVIEASNYLGLRDALPPQPGDEIYTAAQKFGTTASATSIYFTYGYAFAHVLAQVLPVCGGIECASDELISAIRGAGPVTPPNYLAPLDFSNTQNGPTAEVLYRWDTARGEVVAAGDPIAVAPRR